MVENLKIALFVVGGVSAGSGLIVFLLMRFIRRQDERLKLIMKTLYLNTKGIKSVGEKTEMIFQEQQNGFDSQRKSFDHHRVLVSSLNRQLKHIEAALFNDDNLDPSGGSQVNHHVAQINSQDTGRSSMFPGSVNAHQDGEVQVESNARRQGVTLLKSLFEEKRVRTSEAVGNQQKAAKLSAIFADQVPSEDLHMNDEPRRAFNG